MKGFAEDEEEKAFALLGLAFRLFIVCCQSVSLDYY